MANEIEIITKDGDCVVHDGGGTSQEPLRLVNANRITEESEVVNAMMNDAWTDMRPSQDSPLYKHCLISEVRHLRV